MMRIKTLSKDFVKANNNLNFIFQNQVGHVDVRFCNLARLPQRLDRVKFFPQNETTLSQ
jgi:hypothetical protein